MRSRRIPGPNPALREMLAEDGELDRILDGRGLEFDSAPVPAVTPLEPFRIPPADWDEEKRRRRGCDREGS